MAVNDHDWAVVISVSSYAGASAEPPWITNLQGPDNDANAIVDWLTRPDGGGLPADHVRRVPSPAPPAGPGVPKQQEIVDAFKELAELPTDAYDQRSGRRLYVYVSGHGLAAQRHDAAVVTAEATFEDALNVLITSWVDWFWYAARFEEIVLWVDTCATRVRSSVTLHKCDLPAESRSDAAHGRLVIVFAAGFNYTAVETELEGEWHGVFTHALLKGLNGAAGTPVTTQALKKYLFNSMKTFMTPEQRANPQVAKEPWFEQEYDLEFAAPAAPPTFEATLRFPPECAGKRVTLSVNASSPLVADEILAAPEWKPKLPVGAYAVYVPDLGLAKAFQVTGGQDAVVTVQ
jgi:Caspase domain